MDSKNSMILLLKSLEEEGYDRERIEEELDYSQNYIGQQLSKGGNEKIVKSLQRLLQKAKKERESKPADPKAILPIGSLQVTLKDHFDLLNRYTTMMERLVEKRLLGDEPINSSAAGASTEETALSRAQRKYAGMIGPEQEVKEYNQAKKKEEKKAR